ncbi:hypothetical protein POM88_015630 [Heracleum sosnowskyi]|uniref:Potassium channel domain-containing protein n=1 Tax=Heracleum sosnowskyi TaxID=360622 RepID=A0AAD8MWK7_9APIA|nr:hypothetical protein POM88_015630 [Heracleum sosnowskyi]
MKQLLEFRSFDLTRRNYIFDKAKRRMRIRLKVGLAIGVVFSCIGIGTIVLYFMEDLSLIDSFYLSVMSVTTVGYGDRAFKSPQGRLFAAIWFLFSTLAVARAFLYLAEARIDKRHRRIAKWVLHREITVEDLVAADLNHNGFIRLNLSHYAAGELWKISRLHSHHNCDRYDILYKQRELSGNPNLKLNEEQLQNYALAEIERMLNTLGKSLIHFPTIPMPSSIYLDKCINRLILEERSYDTNQVLHIQMFSTQVHIFCSRIMHLLHNDQCEDSRCNVWQHIGCVLIPDKVTESIPAPPDVYYCELCRLNRADP